MNLPLPTSQRNRQFRAPVGLRPDLPRLLGHFHSSPNKHSKYSLEVFSFLGRLGRLGLIGDKTVKSEPKNSPSQPETPNNMRLGGALLNPPAINPQQIVGSHPGYAPGYALGYARTEVKL